CGNILMNGTCLKCNSGAGNSFTYEPTPESFNEVQSISNPPPQSNYKVYLCQLCEINSHYGYECSQRVPLVYKPKPCYNQIFGDNDYPHDSPSVTPLIDHHCCYKCGDSLDDFFCHQCTCEFCGNGAHDGYNCPSRVPFIQTFLSFPQQYPCCEDYGGPHETFQSIAITFDLPIVESEDSLRMRDEHLDTTPETESNKFIKSRVENLVPSPSEFEDLSESECNMPVCDDFTTFYNLLFDADDDFSSSDNESFSDEDISKEIYSNPLFDEEIISMKIDLHHFNVESDLIESMLNHDSLIISSSSKIDSLLDDNDSLSLPENESFHFDSPSSSRPPAKPLDDDSKILTVKVVGDIFKQYVPMHILFPTQPNLASNQEKYPHLLSHWGLKAFLLYSECPMMIYGGNTPILDVPFLHFYPP
nr:hypothetical protein [Tanacetum cinerariifolium]